MKKSSRLFHLLLNNFTLFLAKVRRRLFPAKFRGESKGVVCLNDVQFPYDLKLDPMLMEIVGGYFAEDLVHLMRRYLRPGDVFIDVGANIGYISAQALSLVGKKGQVHAFEPVYAYFCRLEQVKELNPNHSLTANNFALGSTLGSVAIAISKQGNIGWNTIVPGFMELENIHETIDVPVKRLDDYLLEKGLDEVKLIKIDTEGYEFPVLLGLSKFFDVSKHKPHIVCEVAPSAFPKLGYQIKDLEAYMKGYGYRFLRVDTFTELSLVDLAGTTDVLFVPTRSSNGH